MNKCWFWKSQLVSIYFFRFIQLLFNLNELKVKNNLIAPKKYMADGRLSNYIFSTDNEFIDKLLKFWCLFFLTFYLVMSSEQHLEGIFFIIQRIKNSFCCCFLKKICWMLIFAQHLFRTIEVSNIFA
jgi:hypothetical protein